MEAANSQDRETEKTEEMNECIQNRVQEDLRRKHSTQYLPRQLK